MKLRRCHFLTLAVLLMAAPAAAQGIQGFQPTPSQGFGPAPGQQGGFTSPPAQGGGFTSPPGQGGGFSSPPGQGGGFSSPPGQGGGFSSPPQQQQEPPCFKEFTALRLETEKRGQAVQAAGKRKVTPKEACRLFNLLNAAELKFIKFAEDNVKSCGIPPQVPVQIKEGHLKVKEIRDRVCQMAAAPPRPAGPSLSDALGTSSLPDSSNIKTGKGGGTFDTLTGSPLGK